MRIVFASSRALRSALTALSASLLVALVGCTTGGSTPTDAGVRDSGRDGFVIPGVDGGPARNCDNRILDGTETSVDCGGDCEPCAPGQSCEVGEDCTSLVCRSRYCLVASCTDGVQNGLETAADCGGECGRCSGGQGCRFDPDCISGDCLPESICAPSGCDDGELNQDETAVDCGGTLCPPCAGGEACLRSADCASTICDVGTCTESTCTDRVINQDESSIDCGGAVCDPCPDGFSCNDHPDCEGMRCVGGSCVSCVDGIQDAEETDVDCGGGLCDACVDGQMCAVGTDCEGGTCEAGLCVSCVDGVQNQDETDVDCGGTLCGGCGNLGVCLVPTDCTDGVCEAGLCVSCTDGVQNQDESDADCGGTICAPCGTGGACTVVADCASNICDTATSTCNAPGCGDGVLNGAETDLDCGGGSCLPCDVGDSCVLGRDCVEGVCTGGVCAAPSCGDGVANGLETDIDCGGSSSCPRCVDGRLCPNGPSDCMSPLCTSGRCGDVRGHIVLIGHDYFSTNASVDQLIGNAVMMAPETGIIDVLIYDQYADRGVSGEVVHVEQAITRALTPAGRTARFTRLSDSTMLTSALTASMDVFIIAEQESGGSAPFTTIAASWESTLRGFVGAGGVIVTTTFFDNGWRLVDRPMLVDIGSVTSLSGALSVLPAAATHQLAAGVVPYSGPSGTSSFSGVMVGGAIMITPIVANAAGATVVWHALF